VLNPELEGDEFKNIDVNDKYFQQCCISDIPKLDGKVSIVFEHYLQPLILQESKQFEKQYNALIKKDKIDHKLKIYQSCWELFNLFKLLIKRV